MGLRLKLLGRKPSSIMGYILAIGVLMGKGDDLLASNFLDSSDRGNLVGSQDTRLNNASESGRGFSDAHVSLPDRETVQNPDRALDVSAGSGGFSGQDGHVASDQYLDDFNKSLNDTQQYSWCTLAFDGVGKLGRDLEQTRRGMDTIQRGMYGLCGAALSKSDMIAVRSMGPGENPEVFFKLGCENILDLYGTGISDSKSIKDSNESKLDSFMSRLLDCLNCCDCRRMNITERASYFMEQCGVGAIGKISKYIENALSKGSEAATGLETCHASKTDVIGSVPQGDSVVLAYLLFRNQLNALTPQPYYDVKNMYRPRDIYVTALINYLAYSGCLEEIGADKILEMLHGNLAAGKVELADFAVGIADLIMDNINACESREAKVEKLENQVKNLLKVKYMDKLLDPTRVVARLRNSKYSDYIVFENDWWRVGKDSVNNIKNFINLTIGYYKGKYSKVNDLPDNVKSAIRPYLMFILNGCPFADYTEDILNKTLSEVLVEIDSRGEEEVINQQEAVRETDSLAYETLLRKGISKSILGQEFDRYDSHITALQVEARDKSKAEAEELIYHEKDSDVSAEGEDGSDLIREEDNEPNATREEDNGSTRATDTVKEGLPKGAEELLLKQLEKSYKLVISEERNRFWPVPLDLKIAPCYLEAIKDGMADQLKFEMGLNDNITLDTKVTDLPCKDYHRPYLMTLLGLAPSTEYTEDILNKTVADIFKMCSKD